MNNFAKMSQNHFAFGYIKCKHNMYGCVIKKGAVSENIQEGGEVYAGAEGIHKIH